MQQYFIDNNMDSDFITIDDMYTSNHIFNVMRISEGDDVIFVTTDGTKRISRLIDRDSKLFKVIGILDENLELPIRCAIASGFPKGDKLSFISQKATELGASQIYGFPAERSVVKWENNKIDRLQTKLEKVVRGAAEQSRRNYIPELTLFKDKMSFVQIFENFDRVIVAYEESAIEGESSVLSNTLRDIKREESLLFVFGPEGGLSEKEIALFNSKGGICAGLGPRIMRAETAPLYALSAVSYALELNL